MMGGFGKIKQDSVNVYLVAQTGHSAMDSLNEPRLTRQSSLESMLEVDDDFVLVHVFPRYYNDMLQDFTENTCHWCGFAGSDMWLFMCIGVSIACVQSLGNSHALYD